MNRLPSHPDGPRTAVQSHRLQAPASRTDTIRREAILTKVLAADAPRLIVLQGPAGHGKSTTLRQLKTLSEERGLATGWYTLDESDNDPRCFSIHFQALLAALMGETPGQSPGTKGSTAEEPWKGRDDWLIERLYRIGRPVALFLDDFQFVVDKSILAFCRKLFERLPANVRVYLASRSLPEIGLTRLRVNDRALVLRAEDLRFSFEEVEQFFTTRGDAIISEAEIESIYCRTEGWPAALQLFRLSLASPSVRRSLDVGSSHQPRELADYLADSVLALQPTDVQDFLLRTSLLTRLSAPLCNAVTGRTDSQQLLAELERSGLFVRGLDSQLQWFDYHPLFSSFLAEELLSRSPALGMEVHRTAAQWHLSQGNFQDTLHHTLERQDYALAAQALNLWSSRLIADAQLATVEHWYDRLPFVAVIECTELAIKVAYALVFLRRRHKAQPLLEILAQRCAVSGTVNAADPHIVLAMAAVSADDLESAFATIGQVEVRHRSPTGFDAFELGAAANLHGYLAIALGDFERAREYLAFARAYNERGGASFSRGYTLAVSGVVQILRGELHAALPRYRENMAEQRLHLAESFALAALASCYLWALYEVNELQLVRTCFEQYHDIIAESALPDFLVVAYLSAARAHEALGEPVRATEILDELESCCYRNGWNRLIASVNWERARRALVVGATAQARAIAAHFAGKELHPQRYLTFAEDMEGAALGRIRLAIHDGSFAEAARLLAAEFSQQPARVRRGIKLHVLDALLQRRQGAAEAAHQALGRALQLAMPGPYVRVFIEEGPQLQQLLRDEHRTGHDKSNDEQLFLQSLLQASGVDPVEPAGSETPLLEALTSRERQILRHLAAGDSNREMAERIFVSENTIKFHLKNIYSKLGVGTRIHAIAAARALGIIR